VVQLLDRLSAEGCDKMEQTRRLVDLFFVSVLLDAGAGDVWKFREPGTGETYNRSEGIGVASLYMFTSGAFSGEGKASIVDGMFFTCPPFATVVDGNWEEKHGLTWSGWNSQGSVCALG
jgi:hypothetical protein